MGLCKLELEGGSLGVVVLRIAIFICDVAHSARLFSKCKIVSAKCTAHNLIPYFGVIIVV